MNIFRTFNALLISLSNPLNSIAGAGTNDAVMMVTKQLIKNAFSNSGDDDLFFSYESLGIWSKWDVLDTMSVQALWFIKKQQYQEEAR